MHTGELHHDAVQALLLDDGFSHTQFVDTVVQRGDVLLESLILHFARGFGFQAGAEFDFIALRAEGRHQIGELVAHQRLRRVRCGLVAKPHQNRFFFARNTVVAQVFFAQSAAQVAAQRVKLFGQSCLHVHLQHEVHATAQIQTQVHRCSIQGRQPSGRARYQVQRHHIRGVGRIRVERLLHGVFGLKLLFGGFEPRFERVVFKTDQGGCQACSFECLFHFAQGGGVDLGAGSGRRNLYRRCFAKEIGQGVQATHAKSDQDDQVFPNGVTVHGAGVRVKLFDAAFGQHLHHR